MRKTREWIYAFFLSHSKPFIVENKNSKAFFLILLGLLSAFGPFVTDMYLPGLPSMMTFFGTTTAMVQLGLTSSMIGMAVGQLFFGPLSDKYGRRIPLLMAMLLFILSTILCLFSPSIEVFIALRLIQGIAGAGGIVMSRCIATDLFTGSELVNMLAVIGAINGIAPIVSPVVGGFIMNYTDWRGVFLILLVIGVLLLAGCLHFKETHTKERRLNKSLAATFMLLGPVLKNRRYRQFMLQQAFTMSVMFANIASSPFIIQQHYGYSPFAFSVWFAINAVALIMASFVSIKFKKPEQAMLTGAVGTVILAVIELFVLMNDQPFWMYESLIFLLLFTVGLTLPSSTTLAMESERKHAGSASALLGAGVFIMAGIVSPLVGIGNMLVTTGCVFVVGSVLALFCALRSRR